MKKLLSLLSVLTISGSAVPTTIAANPYQKEEKLNSEINLETNNLENLKRNKRNSKNNISEIITKFIGESGSFNNFGVTLNNKIYSASDNRKVYEYNPATGQQKVVITANGSIETSGVALNNKVYFGSFDGKVYEYNPATGQQKVVITTNDLIYSSGVALNNRVYFGSDDKKVYEYNPATGQQKVVITTNGFVSGSGIALNNRVYFGSDDLKVYEYNTDTEQQKIINTDGIAYSYASLGNKLYFGLSSRKVCEYNPATGQQKVVVNAEDSIYVSLTLNNKIYFFSGFKLYEYNPATEQQKVIFNTENKMYNGLVLNYTIYIGSNNEIYGYDPLELIESDIIDMSEQIKRGLFLYYKKQNPNSEIKNIVNINLENLTISDVTIYQKQKNKALNSEQDINICYNVNATFENNSDIEQTQNTAYCSEQTTETNTFQKMNGFSKSKTNSYTDNWSWNWNSKVTAKYSAEGGVPLVTKHKIEVGVEAGGGHTWGGSKAYSIGDVTNSSNTEIKTNTKSITITIPSQPVKVPPHSKIIISVISWKSNIILVLNLYQKVQGMVSADFIDKNNNRILFSSSIKDAMNNLLEKNILPSKIEINNDNTINFSYDIKSTEQIIIQKTEIGKNIPLSSEQERFSGSK